MLSGVSVAVFDGGVDVSAGTPTHIPARLVDLTGEQPVQEFTDHGTGVTAAALFGLVGPGDVAPQPPLSVTSYRVLPTPPEPEDVDGYWALDQIIKTVREDSPQIVNLSVGPEIPVQDDQEPNRWTAELDQLAWDQDVLFVVAAGNHGDQDDSQGLHRVEVPADMANGLTVGACDAPAPAKPWHRAYYSSQGPGRAGSRVQPAGVQFGGVDGMMFPVVRADGTFLDDYGTSFAAPVTTHALAELVTWLPRSNSSVLRAFAVHFAERHHNHVKMRHHVGHGRQPLSFVDTLDASPDEVHVLFVDTVDRWELRGYQLPVPGGLTSGLNLKFTLAFASPVDPTQATDYTRATVDLAFRPHMQMHRMNPPRTVDAKPLVLNIRSPEAHDLMANGWKPSQEPVTRPISGSLGGRVPEHELREAGKWETVRRYDLSLSGSDLLEPRLELDYVARQAGAIDRAPTQVPFALLVSITDKSRAGTLYDETTAVFSSLRPVQRTQSRVRVRSGRSPQLWY
ncbi:MAG: S8 family peptidase [Cellulomonadaceae bacterium]|nr:S8 family peptidase [Cellulomonadaceae bacterium]